MDQINYTYFTRKLSFSPDGSILLVPAGIYYKNPNEKARQVVYGFTRSNLTNPSFILPSLD